MIISRMSPFLGVLAITAVCYSIHAQDNPAQAAARMALAKELFDLNSQQATNAPAPAPAAPAENSQSTKAKAKTDKSAKAAKKAQQEAEKKQAAEAREAAAKAQADREAAAQAQAEQDKANREAAARAQVQMQAKPKQQVVVAQQPEAVSANVNGDNPAQAAARMALAKQLFEMNSQQDSGQNNVEVRHVPPTQAQPNEMAAKKEEKKVQSAPVTAAPAPAARPPAPVVASKAVPGGESNYVGKELGLKQIPAPALPINSSKAARLQDLLQRYKADQISPEEYHRQRAAILSEP